MPPAITSVETTNAAVGASNVAGVLRLRGDDLVRQHSAAQQEPAAAPHSQGRRPDREYREPFDGPNPESWPEGRGVPHYRPLRTNEAATRPLGATTDQRVFVTLMMSGVFVLGRVHGIWASTVGRVANVWEYPVGGQF
ncbi:uncharacterized protein RHOBADRAFT_53722 [Rhodotorula graminis WP1]|uniref:Uncharacterized protein n=1 Tax=Rhodotorula graminis (strain WP1) TaxID=578459 RepID=A0A194S2N2_RHOGW|nr:uncharacterized protein RHOBADRAFT_53722 [Rhodotorula graminis WP1]KPV74784.1 hypothetical protein RHOBADRAFT_53722 [Rhodotorula graminis WP1]